MQTTKTPVKRSPSHVSKCGGCLYFHGGKDCKYCECQASGIIAARPSVEKQHRLLQLWEKQCTKAADARARADVRRARVADRRARAAVREFSKMPTFISQDAHSVTLWHLAKGIADTMIYED
jgi:hypothetical protein